jgi:ATP/maltotriose-dependent transcriptional regulator MalT
LAEEALKLFKEVGDRGGVAHVLLLQAYVANDQGEYVKAGLLLEECLSVFRELGDKRRMALVSVHLARVIFAQGDTVSAHSLAEGGLALAKSLGDKETIALGLSLIGMIALRQDDVATARSLFEESLALSRESGRQWATAEALLLLARVATIQGDYVAARVLFEESLSLCGEVGKITIASCLEGLADLFLCLGENVWAVQLWGKSEAFREAIGVPMPPIERTNYERSVAAAHRHLGQRAFAATWAGGRNMRLEQVLAALPALPPLIAAEPVSAPPATKRVISPDGLTTRESEVLRLVAQGLTDAQVAAKLVISPRTVNTHLKSIYGKIHVTSRSAATRYAIEHKLI